jgi:uncharacterized surface protein with fasciclin (FAS1) repeats
MERFRKFLLISAVCTLPLLAHTSSAAEAETPAVTATLKMPQALAAAGFTSFSALIEAAGLTQSLEAAGPFTCFAPTDACFAKIPAAKQKLFTEDPKNESVVRWIRYHFVEGLAMDREMLVNQVSGAHTMDKGYVRIWVTPGQISINKTSPLVITDIPAANGIIHGVSVPLEPPDAMPLVPARP